MVISEPGLICLETSAYPFLRGFAALWFGPREAIADQTYVGSERPPVRAESAPAVPPAVVASQAEPGPGDDTLIGASEERSVTEAEEGGGGVAATAPLTAQERRARAAAFRGLLLGRQRRYGAAQAAFAEAARLDRALHLEAVPTFWDMERGAHEAAVRAYYEADRTYDASMLASRLRTTFRPRLLNTPRSTPSTVG